MPENWRESDEKEFKICRILYGADFLPDVSPYCSSVEFLIKSHYAQLRTSEKKVADYVLKQGMKCKKMTIESLAEESGVSQPTVMRFVKASGFQNYKEFQYALLCQDMQEKLEKEGLKSYTMKQDKLTAVVCGVSSDEKESQQVQQKLKALKYKIGRASCRERV